MRPYGWQLVIGTGLALTVVLLAVGLVLQLRGRRRAEALLADRLGFEKKLAHLSAGLIDVAPGELEPAIEQALHGVAEFAGVDRAVLHEYLPDRPPGRIAWAGEGVARLPATLARAHLPWTIARIERGESIRFSMLGDLPAEAMTDRPSYEQAHTRSCLMLPLRNDGPILGALSLDAVRAERAWPDELVERLRLLGGVFANVLSRRRADEEVQRLRSDLAHVGRVSTVGELTASLAHELSQPLTAILSNAEVATHLIEGKSADLAQVRAILHDIIEDDIRASEVISRLRRLLKRGPLERTPLDLNEITSEVARLVRSDALARQVSIRLDLAEPLPTVHGDRVHLQQVLLNLILNGLDAMHETPEADRILVLQTARDGAAAVRMVVRDAGPGIDPASLDHIFDAFQTTKPGGLGMGLAIARSIVEAHGGTLRAENHGDGGAAFIVRLPAGGDRP